MFYRYFDKVNNFHEVFNTRNGLYMRTGVFKNDVETDEDPFMREFPNLLDIGIMGSCVHGKSGLCAKSGIQCYQHGDTSTKPNMSFEDFKKIIDEADERNVENHSGVYQVALGGCGDPDMHEDFEEILKYCADRDIVPNFTTSGIGMTAEKAKLCHRYCGAVAVSMYSRLSDYEPTVAIRKYGDGEKKLKYSCPDTIPVMFTFGGTNPNCKYIDPNGPCHGYKINGKEFTITDAFHHVTMDDCQGKFEMYCVYDERDMGTSKNYTFEAINMLIEANVKTNIHFVLNKETIGEAITRLENNGFPEGINAVIFLLHKPIGLGTKENILTLDNPLVKKFFALVNNSYPFKIGFDSCTIPALINLTEGINKNSYDTCEGGRWSAYVTPDMKLLPCSFDNQEQRWAVDLREHSIYEAWHGEKFERFRSYFKTSCKGCKDRKNCLGGCPITPEIVLCERRERNEV